MAKISIRFMNVVRELCYQVEQALNSHFGIPMNFEYTDGKPVSENPEDGCHAKARIFWAGGLNVKLALTSGDGHFGEWHSPSRIEVTQKFYDEASARKWVEDLEVFAGPLGASFAPVNTYSGETRVKITLEGVSLDRLQMNASNRRNDLPTYRWDDPAHPFNAAPAA